MAKKTTPEDIEFQEIKDTTNKSSETIDPTEKPKNKEKIKVNFTNESEVDDYVKTKTKDATEAATKDNNGKTTEEVKNEIKQSEDSIIYTTEDYAMFSEFIINLFDWPISAGLRFYAKDTADTAYSLPSPKRKVLEKQLAQILIKHGARFKIEFLFVFTLVFAYATPFKKAIDRRKAINIAIKNNEPESEETIIEEKADGTKITTKKQVRTGAPPRTGGKPSKS